LERAGSIARAIAPFLWVLAVLPLPRVVLQRLLGSYYARQLMRGGGEPALARHYGSHFRSLADVGRVLRLGLALDDEMGPEPFRAGQARAVPVVHPDRIEIPVLLLWGAEDVLVDVEGATSLLRIVPDSKLVVLDDCGHCPQVERPELVADLLGALPRRARDDAAGCA
jgi:pimeloyl-ACP methyl ester carboxylesterase